MNYLNLLIRTNIVEITLTFEKFSDRKPEVRDLRSDPCLFYLNGRFFGGYLHRNGLVYDITTYYSAYIEEKYYDKLWWRPVTL